jgi:hypothetical protein
MVEMGLVWEERVRREEEEEEGSCDILLCEVR